MYVLKGLEFDSYKWLLIIFEEEIFEYFCSDIVVVLGFSYVEEIIVRDLILIIAVFKNL